ncbi:trypsin delta-like [Maniola jurtina]|uniref:trypsin delta-like n=1 Tax=Maniola jurtina TaxID=191418 RepID=UPI001E68A5B6|nr:trypsin delta-like [Maniola jurtina]
MYWILCLALIAGAASASEQYGQKEIQPQNATVLQQFPSVVQIETYMFWSTMEWVQECAGSILTSRMILACASCTSGWSYEPRFRRIRAGSSFRHTGGLIFYVQDRVNHPSWSNWRYTGDVSVIRLMNALVYSPVIQQASIASPGSWIPAGLRLNQPGWGRVQQPMISNQEVLTASISSCGRRDGNFSNAFNATVDILCAIPQADAAPNYDVGSPWLFNNVTVGIVGGANTLGVYNGLMAADMAKYTEWVIDIASGGW